MISTLMERITGRMDPMSLLRMDEMARRDELLLKKLEDLTPKHKAKDDWDNTYEFNLSTVRNKEIIPIPVTVVDISALSVFHLDDDVTLTINGSTELKCTTTMTMRDRVIKSVELTNSVSSGYVRIYAQGKRKNARG